MKKILLIGINARFSHSNPALYYLRTYCEDLNYSFRILEFTINQKEEEIIRTITEEKPLAICFSVYIWNVKTIKSLLANIPKLPGNCKIILGGPEVSYNAGLWLAEFGKIDYIVTGHGEEGFRKILTNNFNLQNKIVNFTNPHFSQIPFPYKKDDFILFKNRNIYYEASRGCPFKCAYCLSSRSDQRIEFRKFESVREELKEIVRAEPKIIKFVDRTFNAAGSYYKEIWRFLVKEFSGSCVKFHFEIYPKLLDNEDFEFLSKCPPDFFQFEIGIQSANEESLNAVNRKDNWEKIKPAIERLIKTKKIHIHVDMIMGLPFEDIKKTEYSFNEIYSLKASHFQAGILKVLKGTQIHSDTDTFGIKYSNEPPYRIISNRWLNRNRIERLISLSILVDNYYNSQKFSVTLNNLEELFENPFRMYAELAEFIKKEPSPLRTGMWEKNAIRLLHFIQSEFPLYASFFADCLRWDWCSFSKANRFPGFLKIEEVKKAKRKGLNFFQELSKKGEVNFHQRALSIAQLKRSFFFKAETKRFKDKYLGDEEMVVFLPDRSDRIFFSIKTWQQSANK